MANQLRRSTISHRSGRTENRQGESEHDTGRSDHRLSRRREDHLPAALCPLVGPAGEENRDPVYDHGAVNVDMPLLQELRAGACELEMLAGGCDADCHRRRFRTKLIAMGMSGYDRVLIEPSGVFDMDEFFDTLREAPLDRWYEPGNVLTVVDARL